MLRTVSAVAVLLLAALLLLAPALAQQPRQRPAAAPVARPATTPIVTVTKNDGTTVRGRLTAADVDNLALTPPVTTTDPSPQPMTLSWADVKTVSNGLTRAKLLEDWRKEHLADLCPTCHGLRTLPCTTCKGTGHDPAAGKDCPTCHGELLVPCKTPKCKDGKIPCPAPCLKLSEGQWGMYEGKHVRWFNGPGGKRWISEAHLGQLLENRPDGVYPSGAPCPTCGGTTVVTDPACRGTGKSACPTCSARASAPPCPAHCDHGQVPCETCKGTGLKPGERPAEASETPEEAATRKKQEAIEKGEN